LIDRSLWVLGVSKVGSVTASVHRSRKGEVEDSATAFLRLESGATLTLELTWGLLMEKDFAYLNLFGSGGAALLNPFRVHKGMHGTLVNVTPTLETSRNQYRQSMEAQIQHFADALRGAKNPMGVASGPPRSWFTLGYAGGFVFFLVGTHWIALLSDVALTIGWLKYLGWVLAALYLASYWGLATWLAGWLSRRSDVPARWTFAPAFLLVEECRASGELGFPWFQPGYTQHAVLPVLQLASLGSVTLVTLWLLLLNGASAHVFLERRPWHRGRALALALALFVLPPAWGATQLRARPARDGPSVALVQGNIPGEIKWSGNPTDEIFRTFIRL